MDTDTQNSLSDENSCSWNSYVQSFFNISSWYGRLTFYLLGSSKFDISRVCIQLRVICYFHNSMLHISKWKRTEVQRVLCTEQWWNTNVLGLIEHFQSTSPRCAYRSTSAQRSSSGHKGDQSLMSLAQSYPSRPERECRNLYLKLTWFWQKL